jgi:hypothetical protein
MRSGACSAWRCRGVEVARELECLYPAGSRCAHAGRLGQGAPRTGTARACAQRHGRRASHVLARSAAPDTRYDATLILCRAQGGRCRATSTRSPSTTRPCTRATRACRRCGLCTTSRPSACRLRARAARSRTWPCAAARSSAACLPSPVRARAARMRHRMRLTQGLLSVSDSVLGLVGRAGLWPCCPSPICLKVLVALNTPRGF